MVGRRAGRTPVWFWHSEVSNKRISWFFPSVKEANKFKDQKWWRYAQYKTIDEFIDANGNSEKEKEWWLAHRDNYIDWKLRSGMAIYDTENYKD